MSRTLQGGCQNMAVRLQPVPKLSAPSESFRNQNEKHNIMHVMDQLIKAGCTWCEYFNSLGFCQG
jgi:hypothetical protein